MSVTGTLRVNVLDVNEKPEFRKFYIVKVTENAAIETELTTVSAQDPDAGTNGILSYTFVSGNEDNIFRLNEVSFILLINKVNKIKFKLYRQVFCEK